MTHNTCQYSLEYFGIAALTAFSATEMIGPNNLLPSNNFEIKYQFREDKEWKKSCDTALIFVEYEPDIELIKFDIIYKFANKLLLNSKEMDDNIAELINNNFEDLL